MLKTQLQKYAFKCGLSKRLQTKSSIIIEILQECSSGLTKSKHKQLIDFMELKLLLPDDLDVQNKITSASIDAPIINLVYKVLHEGKPLKVYLQNFINQKI